MKNKRLLIIAALCLSAAILSIQVAAQSEDVGHFINPEMSLIINLEKDTYKQWEPVILRSRIENKTDTVLTTLIPDIVSEGSILIESGKEKREFDELSIIRPFLARQPVTLDPGQGLNEEFVLERDLDEFFPKPGVYMIRILLSSTGGKRIVSNPVEIHIESPTGIDKEALEFIKRNKAHSRYPILFTWNNDVRTENGKTLLEEFVSKYSGSVYGDYAIYQLGNYYFVRREFDKAKIELNKVKNSPISRIAKESKQTLSNLK